MAVTPLYFPGLFKIDYGHTLGGKTFHVVRWGLMNMGAWTGDIPSATLGTLASDMQTLWVSHVQPYTTVDTTYDGCEVTDFTSASGLSSFIAAGGAGSDSGPTLPIQVAVETAFHINRRYRGGKPRAYLSGVGEPRQSSPTQWHGTFVSGLDTAWNAWINGFGSYTYTFGSSTHGIDAVNYSRFSGNVERPTAAIDGLVSAHTNVGISSQRRRRGRI